MAPSAASWPHYTWAAGHGLVLLCSLRYFLAYITFKSAGYEFYYKTAYLGTLLSYAIVCYKSLGTPQPNKAYVQRALADENVQYLLLALYWRASRPIPLSLVPYAIFSLFHVLTFVRANVIPMLSPPPAAPAGQTQAAAPQHPMAKAIHTWVKGNYDSAMILVARVEVILLVRVTLGVILLANSLFTPIFYAHFLRVRYYHSNFSRDTIHTASGMMDQLVANPSLPPIVGQTWASAKGIIGRWGSSSVLSPRPAAPQGAQGAAPNAQRQ